ncbi:MAG: J domain-containing protein [Archangium sp.]|nr:J domain-containing protein [Archangium sp.]
MYQEVFQADTKVRLRPTEELRQSAYTAVKNRLDTWLRSLDRKDPYRRLGCSPFDSDETLRAKYRELAKANHPDRGGNPEVMREINEAWSQIQDKRMAVKQHALAASIPV